MWGICLQTGLLISGYSFALNSQGHSLKGEEHISGIIFIVDMALAETIFQSISPQITL